MTRLLLYGFLILLLACRQTQRPVERGFYYWKTVFDPTANEKSVLDSLHAKSIYLRLFDVGVDEATGAVLPEGKLQWEQEPPAGVTITPVVFVTQEALIRCDSAAVDVLAARIASLSASLLGSRRSAPELQIDCDWSAGTRGRYFQLLRMLRKQPFMQDRALSVTIRLHQVKYASQTGIPPADRGLLMCYNMGSLRDPKSANSILETGELEKYLRPLSSYPLPLDVALPVFDWYVWFSGSRYKGLIHGLRDSSYRAAGRYSFPRDTTIDGYSFVGGDWLRHETSDPETVQRAAGLLGAKLPPGGIRVLLFDLDEKSLSNYTNHELESFFERLRRGGPGLRAAKRN